MTQRQTDTLKELGFKKLVGVPFYEKNFYSELLGRVEFHVEPLLITIHINNRRTDYPFTLTKLREIVGKLEKL